MINEPAREWDKRQHAHSPETERETGHAAAKAADAVNVQEPRGHDEPIGHTDRELAEHETPRQRARGHRN